MTKFEKIKLKAETLQIIYDVIDRSMLWTILWDNEDERKPVDNEDERYKYEVYQAVLEMLEEML